MVYLVTVRETAAAKTTKKTGPAKVQKRRSPISREEGERRLANAARELVQTRPFSEVSVRDIAELADVNHGFVHTWFGSKNDLLARVAQDLLQEISKEAETAAPGEPAVALFDPRIQLAVRMLLWLNLEGYDSRKGINLVILDALRRRYHETDGLSASDAETAAIIIAALGMGVGAFAPIFGSDPKVDLNSVFPMWRHILGLLAKHPYQ
ncbi:MAG: hypothetical protein RIR69_1000 [Actinomycetota bacterium]|jgi:AcrR family transcriptional regulator